MDKNPSFKITEDGWFYKHPRWGAWMGPYGKGVECLRALDIEEQCESQRIAAASKRESDRKEQADRLMRAARQAELAANAAARSAAQAEAAEARAQLWLMSHTVNIPGTAELPYPRES